MDKELEKLLDQARSVTQTEVEEHRITLAAANGHLSDDRVTVETVKATRTIMKAAEGTHD